MKEFLNVLAPAKLNTFLHIVGQRKDGYHLLQSVFMLIDWYDTLHFEIRRDAQISREDLTQPLPQDDLIVRAAKSLQQATGCTQGAHIRVQKEIPSEAGMGGGSSDAASTLIVLNHLWRLGLKRQQLIDIGVGLGSDIPFFLSGGNAWVQGIGEQITPIALPKQQFVVIKPQQGVSTQQIFQATDLTRNTKSVTMEDFATELGQDFFAFGRNDMQKVAQKHCPQITQALSFLSALNLKNARMTGSGSAVFAPLARELSALEWQTLRWYESQGFSVKVCNNLSKHPLCGWLDD